MGIPFMIAFNTLINYEILIEDDEENEWRKYNKIRRSVGASL
jgi:hypothetical protein